MANSSRPGPSSASRKILWLGVAVIVVCVLYGAAWSYGASEIRSRLAAFMANAQSKGVTLECGGLDVKGFPFRFELFCSKPGFADLEKGGSAQAEALRSAAQVYAPRHIVWEADGPLSGTLASGEKLDLNWQTLQSSLELKTGGLERSSLAVDGLDLTLSADGTVGVLKSRAAHGEAHVRQNGDDLDAALLLRDVGLTSADMPALPPFSASLEATLAGKAGVLDGWVGTEELLRSVKGEVQRAVVDIGEGRVVTISGPFEIDENGLISGKLAIEVEKFAAWQPVLEGAMPDKADAMATGMGAVRGMADQNGTVRANIVLDKGAVLLGFIPLGIRLPPVR